MKPIWMSLVVAGLITLGSAQAKSLEFSDDQFDYSDSGLETAYIMLANDGGTLELSLSSQASDNAVATIDVTDEVAGYDTDNNDALFWIESNYRVQKDAAAMFSDIDLDFRANHFERVTLTHKDQLYATVKESYLSKLEALGYTCEMMESKSNADIYRLQSGDETLRLIFIHQGNDTQVTFSQS
jgi:hypothetical protein